MRGVVISGRGGIGASIRRGAKSIALLGAAVILAAQLLALAHSHQANPIRQFNAQRQVVADDGLCALCTLAFHAPFNPATAPAIANLGTGIRLLLDVVAGLPASDPFSSCQTRAPPAAIL
jgi:hypothetical protein